MRQGLRGDWWCDTPSTERPLAMLRDRYAAVDRFALAPVRALRFEPVRARLEVLRDALRDALRDDDTLFEAVRADLARRFPRTPTTGRPSTPVAVVLRRRVIKRLYGGSDAATERVGGDALVLRQVCRLGLERVPDHPTLLRWAALIEPATLEARLDRVVALARRLHVTRGRTLRLDRTVVETAVHHPTDASLLVAGVRMLGRLGRLVRRARPLVGEALGAPGRARRHPPLLTIARATATRSPAPPPALPQAGPRPPTSTTAVCTGDWH